MEKVACIECKKLRIKDDNRSRGTPIIDLVKDDLEERREKGIETYREELKVGMSGGNEFDGLENAYQESLDLCVYLKWELENRKREEESHAKD